MPAAPPRSGDAIFASAERVVSNSLLFGFEKLIDFGPLFDVAFDLLGIECRIVHPHLWSSRASIAYGFGRG